MRWAESGADEDGRVLDRERDREREREVLGAPDCGRSDYRPGSWRREAWPWSILFPTIERPEATPMRWAGSGADGRGLDRGRERREREVVFLGAPDCGRSDYRPWPWRRDGVVLVIIFSTMERPETTPMRLGRIQSGPRLNVCR